MHVGFYDHLWMVLISHDSYQRSVCVCVSLLILLGGLLGKEDHLIEPSEPLNLFLDHSPDGLQLYPPPPTSLLNKYYHSMALSFDGGDIINFIYLFIFM